MRQYPALFAERIRSYGDAILCSYSEIFFLRGRRVGAVVLAITFLNPNAAIAGLVAVIAAYAFARFIAIDRSFLASGFYTYNALLVGLAIGYLFQLTALTLVFVVAAGVLAFVATLTLHSLFTIYLKLPVFGTPFTLVTWATYLAAARFPNLYVSGLYHRPHSGLELYLPLPIAGFLKSMGTILFLPDVLPGLLFTLVLGAASRILVLLGIAGYYAGTVFVALLAGSFDAAFRDVSHFNFILIAMALGGVFLVPSRWSYAVALIGVLVSAIVLEAFKTFWSGFGVSGFVLPLNTPTYILTTMLFLYVLGATGFPRMARFIRATPEETLDYYLSDVRRYRGAAVGLTLPFSGRWVVWQGCDGRWTHQGAQRHAYDFVIRDADGRTHAGEGKALAEYHAFNKPVLSPARGRVLKVEKTLPDNPIGQVDTAHRWGNLVIIQDVWGNFICLAHFAQGSIRVAEGDWVECGTLLGRCGNSGYSPQPHIHIQVQINDRVGAATLPFGFVSYLSGGTYRANEPPAEGADVEPCFPDKEQEACVTFLLDDRHCYEAFRAGRKVGDLNFVVCSAADGSVYFDSGRGKLFIGAQQGTFYFYSLTGDDPYLRAMFQALPRLPLAVRDGLCWSDHLPMGVLFSGVVKEMLLLVASVAPSVANIRVDLRRIGRREIRGEVSYPLLRLRRSVAVELEDALGFKTIRVDDLELRRVVRAIRSEAAKE
ncbi:putative urea transporter [uncultured Gammaproteobacteria bacterium]